MGQTDGTLRTQSVTFAACVAIFASPANAQAHDAPRDFLVASSELPSEYRLPRGNEAQAPAHASHIYPPNETLAQYEDFSAERERQFRKRIVTREVIFQILNVVDTVQTIDCLNRNVCHEMNPILGRNPSTHKLIGIKALSGGIHAIGTHLFKEFAPSGVDAFQITSLIVQSGAVVWNVQHSF